jgi:hypothetical protein
MMALQWQCWGLASAGHGGPKGRSWYLSDFGRRWHGWTKAVLFMAAGTKTASGVLRPSRWDVLMAQEERLPVAEVGIWSALH